MDEDGGSSGELYRAMFCRAFFFIAWTFWLTMAFLARHTLFAFLLLPQLVMGWGSKALDGWIGGLDRIEDSGPGR